MRLTINASGDLSAFGIALSQNRSGKLMTQLGLFRSMDAEKGAENDRSLQGIADVASFFWVLRHAHALYEEIYRCVEVRFEPAFGWRAFFAALDPVYDRDARAIGIF
jgi:hypothetical protein